ncbi:CBS domain-containing protein [Oleiagrimonas sp. C23AA]|uniref:CBS domain-containing protein n=1 Tax=Oleiagrimonas sp. C23AA TaxID=2719047 RepID=UPI00141EE7D7|nr:CBS domain-containing protein [Oleiagrimonas sp. C23AA]NII12117.1 CBS domain-containing protein [Oleiagrimonas sp. C23AA]
MQFLNELLALKGHAVHAIDPDAPVRQALERMAEHNVGALLVMRDERLEGVISERDYARKVALSGRTSADTPVREIMSDQPITVDTRTSVEACMRLCTDSRIRHLPVMDGERVIGVVSIGDLVRAVIDAQAQAIDQLQTYIAG